MLCSDASTGIQTICPPEHKGEVCTTSRCRRLAGRPKGVLPWGRGKGRAVLRSVVVTGASPSGNQAQKGEVERFQVPRRRSPISCRRPQ